MKSIQAQRNEMEANGIDPDCMPDGYWAKAAEKRKKWKEYKAQCIADAQAARDSDTPLAERIQNQIQLIDRMKERNCKNCDINAEEKQLAKLIAEALEPSQ